VKSAFKGIDPGAGLSGEGRFPKRVVTSGGGGGAIARCPAPVPFGCDPTVPLGDSLRSFQLPPISIRGLLPTPIALTSSAWL
jgi:hypothetical protein